MKKLLVEALGTFFLVLVIALTGDPIAIGVVLMVMVYMGGHISGAHYNPAVTLGVWMRGDISTKKARKYVVAQIVGGLVAVCVAYMLGSSFVPTMGGEYSLWQAFIAEVLFTFALVGVVLSVAFSKATEGNSYYGLAIGLTLMVGVAAVGNISGGVFNPAVGLGPWIFDLFTGGGFAHIWLYILAPLAGGALAAWFYNFVYPAKK